ncbi:hypothetical protein HYV79_02440 [Candidatus Woesearchaeota archaeon]|nr:hypothetical protein [Candidatus Woesearchaeota archaeon]
MDKKVARDTPLAEITLRKYPKPYNLEGRDLVKKLCLSLGLLNPGDSRDSIVDVFHVILKSKEPVLAVEIEDLVKEERKKLKIPLLGITSPNIRRHLRRLKNYSFIESKQNKYSVAEQANLLELFEEKIEQYYLKSILDRIKEYLKKINE